MSWNLKNDRPIYIQLVEQIQMRIISGIYQSGGKLPSVRELATEASVNPNTMQRALSELERLGLVYTNRTSGRFITENEELIKKMKSDLAKEQIYEFISHMKELGIEIEELIEILLEESKKEAEKEASL